jgi:predicted metal-binding protein
VDEVDHMIRNMSVVRCGGCFFRRYAREAREWRCVNRQCDHYSHRVTKDSHDCCGWWEPRTLFEKLAS